MHHNNPMLHKNDILEFRTFLINLDVRTDRLLSAQQEFRKLCIPYTRVSAVTPDKLENVSIFVKPTVAACWESHVSVFKHMISENVDIALICEDDLVFKNFKLEKFITAMRELELDILQVGFLYGTIGRKIDVWGRNLLHVLLLGLNFLRNFPGMPSKFRQSPQVQEVSTIFPWVVPGDFRFGTHCYLITKQAAEEILGIGGFQFLAADDFFIALSKMKHFKISRAINSKCGQSNSPSSILSG
jgi:GR25 family glycosyltransferase involved in LPS biosynthesis